MDYGNFTCPFFLYHFVSLCVSLCFSITLCLTSLFSPPLSNFLSLFLFLKLSSLSFFLSLTHSLSLSLSLSLVTLLFCVHVGETCGRLGTPFLGKCEYSGANASLSALYGNLKPQTSAVAANLMTFDQSQFIKGSSVGPTGYVYVPSVCQSNSTACKLHVVFHGCEQNIKKIGETFVQHTGLNEWAESNAIIVLYPQVTSLMLSNPNACFNWWGYDGDKAYAYRTGKQMAFVKALIDRLMGQ